MKKFILQEKSESILQALLNVYLIIVFWIIPLYLPIGYTGAGEKKSLLFIICALILAAASFPFAVFRVVSTVRNKNGSVFPDRGRKSIVLLLLAAALLHVLSFVSSGYKQEALLGTNGWRMGFVPQLLFLYFAFLIILFYRMRSDAWYIIFMGEAAVLVMGVLNRLGFYPVPGTDIGMHYISTIGNNDWFAVYLTVLYPLNLGLLMQVFAGNVFRAGEKEDRFLRILLTATMFLAQWNLVMLGSSASLFIMAAPLPVLIIPLVTDRNHRFSAAFLLSMGVSLELSCLAVRIHKTDLWNDVFTPENPLTFTVNHHVGLVLIALGACVLLISKKHIRTAAPDKQPNRRYLLLIPIVILLAIPLVILMIQLARPAALNDDFGNGRGFIWKTGSSIYRELGCADKIAGTGQDTFGIAVAERAKRPGGGSFAAALKERFGSARLTNSHSILLNKMVETGAAGTAAYTLLMVCGSIAAVLEFVNKKDYVKLAAAVSVICYFLFGGVFFEQVTAAPAVYVMIGMIGAESDS